MLIGMGKGKRLRAARPNKLTPGATLGGDLSHLNDDDGGAFFMGPGPSDPVWDRSRCPVGDHCAGCGATSGLSVMVSSFGPGEVACATVCRACDGRSMLHLDEVGFGGLGARVRAHQRHLASV